MDRTICANESSRGRGFSASRLVDRLGLVGRPGEGAGSRLRGSRHGGAGFCGLGRSQMLFCFTKTLAGGCPQTPERPSRAMSMGAERRSRIHLMAHAGHAARGIRSTVENDDVIRFRGSILHRENVERLDRKPETGGAPTPPGGRVRALRGILRPLVPPNHPQDAHNGRESGFPGSTGCCGSMAWTSRAEDPLTGGFSSPRRSQPSSRLAVRRGLLPGM